MLLALDHPKLGYIEVSVQKSQRQIAISFRSADNHVLKLADAQSKELVEALAAKAFTVTGLKYQPLTEKADITTTESAAPDENEPPKRYAFDMHI
jgi:hypothetical protein